MSLSLFITEYLEENFKVSEENIRTIYSSTNTEHFPGPKQSREDSLNELVKEIPELSKIDLSRPIFLFVGAFERKGLHHALRRLEEVPNCQFIVIGKPEAGQKISFSAKINVFHIGFTKKIKTFYELADVFIFPTSYEPFGLVITEAAAMGNLVLVPRKMVGASEILGDLESIKFIDEKEIDLKNIKPLSREEKQRYSNQIKERLSIYSWEKAAASFINFIE